MEQSHIPIKNLLITLGLYAGMFAIIYLLNLLSPGGPCTPALGYMLLITIFPIFVFASFLITLYFASKGKEGYSIPMIIHGLVLAFIIYKIL